MLQIGLFECVALIICKVEQTWYEKAIEVAPSDDNRHQGK